MKQVKYGWHCNIVAQLPCGRKHAIRNWASCFLTKKEADQWILDQLRHAETDELLSKLDTKFVGRVVRYKIVLDDKGALVE
jgi:hypothetical protein